MLHADIGPTHLNESLSSINVPSVGESTLKACERQVGPQIEKLAKESCLKSLESERKLWKEESEKENVEMGASYNMGWQRRGKAHNSLTGTMQILHLRELKRVQLDVHFHRKLLFFSLDCSFAYCQLVSWPIVKVNKININ